MPDVTILLVSGSTWAESPHSRILRRLHQMLWPGAWTDLYDGMLDLPAFVPGADREPVAVRDLLDRIDTAHGVLFSTPEYAGGLPGAFKNLLDWTMGGGLDRKPVGWLDVAQSGLGDAARTQLRAVLSNVGARIVEQACLQVTPASDPLDGAAVRAQDDRLAAAMSHVVATIRKQRHAWHPWI
jgi:chromate reductase, NAD(P)H dehydrogenase (quinone)